MRLKKKGQGHADRSFEFGGTQVRRDHKYAKDGKLLDAICLLKHIDFQKILSKSSTTLPFYYEHDVEEALLIKLGPVPCVWVNDFR